MERERWGEEVENNLIEELARQTGMSRVNATILVQLKIQAPMFIEDYGVKAILALSDKAIRLHTRNRGKALNVDITYNEGQDAYDLCFTKVDGLHPEKVESSEKTYIMFDQLDDAIRPRVLDLGMGRY